MIASGIREKGGLDAACPAAQVKIELRVACHFISAEHTAIPESSREELMIRMLSDAPGF